MIEVVQGLCESNNFDVHDFDSGIDRVSSKIAVPYKDGEGYQEYYVLLQSDDVSDDFLKSLAIDGSEELMGRLELLDFTDESFRKNSTLILCCSSVSISDSVLLQFEENPYFFKKNAITYSDAELLNLKEKLNGRFNNEILNSLLAERGGSFFDSFKTMNLPEGHYYPLLIRLITKLPFVHYLPQSNNLEDLDEFVRKELVESDLKLLDYVLSEEYLIDDKVSSDWEWL